MTSVLCRLYKCVKSYRLNRLLNSQNKHIGTRVGYTLDGLYEVYIGVISFKICLQILRRISMLWIASIVC